MNGYSSPSRSKFVEVTQPTQALTQRPSISRSEEAFGKDVICRLVCTTERIKEKYLDLKVKPGANKEWLFGRNNNVCDFALNNKSNRISNKHFKIWLNNKSNSNNLMLQDLSTNGTYLNGSRVVKNNNYIVTQGDEISVGNGVPEDVITYIVVIPKDIESANISASGLNFGIHSDFFIRSEVVGSGAFATVKKLIERKTGDTYAVKIISKRKLMNGGLEGVTRELEILKKLDHPGIVRLKAFYEDMDNYYLVMEYVPGGDLMDFVAANGAVGESAGREITRQILEAINYVHSKGISHRDLKPDNILIAQDDPVNVKVTDFGLAKISDSASVMKTFCGTLAYVAPEVIVGKFGESKFKGKSKIPPESQNVDLKTYSSKVDMWSLACLTYVILTAHLPFSGSTQDDLFVNIVNKNYHESLLRDLQISQNAIDFLDKLFLLDVNKRLSASEALKHPWFHDFEDSNNQSQISLSQSQSQQKRLGSQAKMSQQAMKDDILYEEDEQEFEDLSLPKDSKPMFKIPAKKVMRELPKSQQNKFHYVNDATDIIAEEHSMNGILGGSSSPTKKKKSRVIPEVQDPDNLSDFQSNLLLLTSTPKANKSGYPLPSGTFLTLQKVPDSIPNSKSLFFKQGENLFVLGRNYQLSDDRCSKIHCIILKKRHPVTANSIYESAAQGLEDLWLLDNSTNGCYVNDVKIGKNKKIKLHEGDIIDVFRDGNKKEKLSYQLEINDRTGLFVDKHREQRIQLQNESDQGILKLVRNSKIPNEAVVPEDRKRRVEAHELSSEAKRPKYWNSQ